MTLPGDSVLTTSLQVQVVGSGTAFDQTYWPVSVRRTLSMDQGYVMTLTAKNASPGLGAGPRCRRKRLAPGFQPRRQR